MLLVAYFVPICAVLSARAQFEHPPLPPISEFRLTLQYLPDAKIAPDATCSGDALLLFAWHRFWRS